MTTPRPDVPQDLSVPVPPPGCPAHDLGPDGTHRLYGPVAETDPPAMYELLRREYGPVAPVLLHGDLPAWLVLGHRENLEVMRTLPCSPATHAAGRCSGNTGYRTTRRCAR
ncbi:hypothetical protein [Streptomyces clavuligerus]|uniref:hypothetical protein n=1 Tax=Streptomyces clavuligerus TaxID=1901 RepID=UPI0039C5CB54